MEGMGYIDKGDTRHGWTVVRQFPVGADQPRALSSEVALGLEHTSGVTFRGRSSTLISICKI